MAKKGYSFKEHRQGGGWKGYLYRRAKSPGNSAALAKSRENVQKECKGVKDPAERRTCFSVASKGGSYKP